MVVPHVLLTLPILYIASTILLCGNTTNGQTVEHNGLVLSVSIPATAAPGSVPLELTLVNRGRNVAQVGETGYTLDCKMTIRTKNGRACRFTPLGNTLFGEKESGAQFALIRLEKGQIRRWKFNLAKAFKELTPSSYLLTLEANAEFCNSPSAVFSETKTLIVRKLPFQVHEAREKQ